LYYKDATAAIVTFDVGERDSFEACDYWIQELERNEDIKIKLLVGNKVDMGDARVITTQQGKEYAKRNGLVYCETSAKTSEGINKLFEKVAREILR
jgi:Ras-related protein Rab-5C